jgi:hypothetical protein
LVLSPSVEAMNASAFATLTCANSRAFSDSELPCDVETVPEDDLASAALGLTRQELDSVYGPGNAVQTGWLYEFDEFDLTLMNDMAVDHGLTGSNPALLRAAKDLGVKYLHGNMSFKSHQPSCFNCSIVHPLEKAVTVVPDWPTNIAYFSTNPDEETYFYNWFYAPNGKFPFYDTYQTYAQVLDHDHAVAAGQAGGEGVDGLAAQVGRTPVQGRQLGSRLAVPSGADDAARCLPSGPAAL